MTRRIPQTARVLMILADGRWHSTIEFVDAGILRAAARVHELRHTGHVIESRHAGSAVASYRLTGDRSIGQLSLSSVCQECSIGGGAHLEGCPLSPLAVGSA
ncbi:MAG TPA: helix-turn-helix domain-containing protein [Gaiellaceae bacterium]